MDVARWALNVEYPDFVHVDAGKHYFVNDGWTMYDTMEATFRFKGNKILKWDGKSRSGYQTYGSGRGVIVYGQQGTVYIDPYRYKVFDLEGKPLLEKGRPASADDGTTAHMVNFFNAVRGKEELNSPIETGRVSNLLCNYANISYRTGKSFEVDHTTGHIRDAQAMELWKRDYEPGWEPKI